MRVEQEPAALRHWVRAERARGVRVAFVPTMGALHEGHLRLVSRATARSEIVVASVFVNPLQFGPEEDFDAYPRDPARDRALLEAHGVTALFLPPVTVMLPEPPAVSLVAPTLTRTLCGPHRPGHFEGVLTIVAKLLHIVEPDVAVFGRKDAQQAVLIARMVRDLDLPVTIDVAPTVREADGLAMSSRNAYLAPAERRAARALSEALEAGHQAFRTGRAGSDAVLGAARDRLAAEPMVRLQYLELVHPATLAPLEAGTPDALLAVAAFVGTTRLIDNVVLGKGLAGDDRAD